MENVYHSSALCEPSDFVGTSESMKEGEERVMRGLITQILHVFRGVSDGRQAPPNGRKVHDGKLGVGCPLRERRVVKAALIINN